MEVNTPPISIFYDSIILHVKDLGTWLKVFRNVFSSKCRIQVGPSFYLKIQILIHKRWIFKLCGSPISSAYLLYFGRFKTCGLFIIWVGVWTYLFTRNFRYIIFINPTGLALRIYMDKLWNLFLGSFLFVSGSFQHML